MVDREGCLCLPREGPNSASSHCEMALELKQAEEGEDARGHLVHLIWMGRTDFLT